MASQHALGSSGGAAAHQYCGVVIRLHGHRWPARQAIKAQQGLEPSVSLTESNALAVFFFLEQSVSEPQMPGQIILDPCRDYAFDSRLRLNRFDLLIKSIQHNDGLGAGCLKRVLRLALRICWIERRCHRADFPGAEFRNQKL